MAKRSITLELVTESEVRDAVSQIIATQFRDRTLSSDVASWTRPSGVPVDRTRLAGG
jgi:hypothetical protein